MQLRVETRRWKRLLRLFAQNDGKGIEDQTHVLKAALSNTYRSEAEPLIRTWDDMRVIVENVIEASKAEGCPTTDLCRPARKENEKCLAKNRLSPRLPG